MSKGIQNNRVLTVDVVYTQRGRYYKSINSPDAEIVKFALADDGVDYNLYDDNLPDDEKAKKITNTPQFSAWTDETALMKNKLMSLPRNTEELGSLEVSSNALTFEINPGTRYGKLEKVVTLNAGFPTPSGYTVTLRDSKYAYLTFMGKRGTTRRTKSINGEGRIIDTIHVNGQNKVPNTSTFTVVYDESHRLFDRASEYKTTLVVESLDRGVTEEIEVIFKPV